MYPYGFVRSVAASSFLKVIKRFPRLARDSLPDLLFSLQEPTAIEDSALGACQILLSRSMIRHLMQVTYFTNAFNCYVCKMEDIGQSINFRISYLWTCLLWYFSWISVYLFVALLVAITNMPPFFTGLEWLGCVFNGHPKQVCFSISRVNVLLWNSVRNPGWDVLPWSLTFESVLTFSWLGSDVVNVWILKQFTPWFCQSSGCYQWGQLICSAKYGILLIFGTEFARGVHNDWYFLHADNSTECGRCLLSLMCDLGAFLWKLGHLEEKMLLVSCHSLVLFHISEVISGVDLDTPTGGIARTVPI